MNMSLSIPEWHQMAMKGEAPPVRILLNGGSMSPLIRWNKDYVTIVPIETSPVIGDIVLFVEPGTDRYVVHRVWEIKDAYILTWGDNCTTPDRWLPQDAVWGKVILIERGHWEIITDPAKGMRWARFWHQAGKAYRLYKRCRNGIIRRIKKLFA